MEVADEGVGLFEVLLDGVELQLGCCEPLFDGVEFAADAVLFGLEEVEWDGSGVVGFEELGALVQESALAADESLSVLDVVLAQSRDLFEQHLLGLKAEVAGKAGPGRSSSR